MRLGGMEEEGGMEDMEDQPSWESVISSFHAYLPGVFARAAAMVLPGNKRYDTIRPHRSAF